MSCTTTPSGSGAKTSSSPGPTREAEWARQYDGWEVVYDGVDTPADNVPNHLRWDNPIDDDWADRQTTFRPNQPVPGFLTVDRATRPEDRNRTGMIWRRDEALSFAAGLTIELRVRILPATTADAFFVTWIDDQGSGGVFLSPSTVKVGNAYPWNPGTTVGFDTSSDFHVYRVVRTAGSYHISVYVDDGAVPLVEGSGDGRFRVGGTSYNDYPYVLLGDGSVDEAYRAGYVLDFVRYRRGAYPPGVALAAAPGRTPPPLPAPAGIDELFSGFDGSAVPSRPAYVVTGRSTAWTAQPGGFVELDTIRAGATSTAEIRDPPGIENKSDLTLEIRARVFPDSGARGFTVNCTDLRGGLSLTLSPDRAEVFLGVKPVGIVTVPMDTTDRFHTFRLVRTGLYFHLYVDDAAAPAVVDEHIDGTTPPYVRVWFGALGIPQPGAQAHVLIEHVRWHTGALAPTR